MALVAIPPDWNAAALDSAVWSDPAPVRAVLAAIAERAAVSGVSVQPETASSYHRAWMSAGYAYTVGDWPGAGIACVIADAIRALAPHFVDMEYDYASRDWAEFPVMLDSRMGRGEHPMSAGPGIGHGESPEDIAAWRAFLADCRWWLNRMTTLPVRSEDYRFGKRVTISSDYHRGTSYYDDGTIRDQWDGGDPIGTVAETESEGLFSGDFGAILNVSASNTASCAWSSAQAHMGYYLRQRLAVESAVGCIFADLRVRNRLPIDADLLVVACGGVGYSPRLGSVTKHVGEKRTRAETFEYGPILDPAVRPVVASASRVDSTAYQTAAMSGRDEEAEYDRIVCDMSSGSRTRTAWSRDFSESYSSVASYSSFAPSGSPPSEIDEKTWTAVPRPSLLGLESLGPTAFGRIAAGGRSQDIMPWQSGRFDPVLAESWWRPDEVHGYANKDESRGGAVYYGLLLVPCLDFSATFRFRAEEETTT